MLNILMACGTAATTAAGNGCYDWPVIKQIIIFFGWIIGYIYQFFDMIGIGNIGFVIIIFTLIVKFCLLPLTIKQQKFSKLNSIMQPEIQAIQAKYKGRNDTYSMQSMQEETKKVYSKYGVSQAGGCLQTFIQMPIIIALYGVIRQLPIIMDKLAEPLGKIVDILNGSGVDYSGIAPGIGNPLVEASTQMTSLYSMTLNQWDAITGTLSMSDPVAALNVTALHQQVQNVNMFLGFDISQSPWNLIKGGGIGIIAILLPIIAGLSQWLSFKLTQTKQSAASKDATAATMNSMGFVMPLVSVFFCFTVNAGIGLYWAASSLFQVVLQIFINRHYRKIDMDKFVEENLKKAAEKAERKKNSDKKRTNAATIMQAANTNTKNIETPQGSTSPSSIAQRANLNVETGAAKAAPAPNSLAAKAGMVSRYNAENGIDMSEEAQKKTHRKYKK